MTTKPPPVALPHVRSHPTAPRAGAVDRPLGPLLLAIGSAMAVVGWLDLALAWVPPRFGDPEWEFATVSRTFDGMALGALGLALLGTGVVLQRYRRLVAVASVLSGLFTVLLLGLVLLYGLSVPVALQAADGPIRPLLTVAIARTSTFAVVYLGLFAWLTWFFWRQRRAIHDPR